MLGVPRSSTPLVLGPLIANDGVPVKPSFCGFFGRRFDLFGELWLLRSLFHLAMSLTPAPLATAVRNSSVDVARVLLALVAVEELEEVPAAALFAGGERRGAGRASTAAPMIVKLRKTIFASPLLDLVFDHLRQDFFGIGFADRALQVAVLDQFDLRLRLAQDQSVLGNAADQRVDRRRLPSGSRRRRRCRCWPS